MNSNSHKWLIELAKLRDKEIPSVLLTVISSKGSTPREAGTKMVVTADKQFETIGGGKVEFEAIKLARQMIKDSNSKVLIKEFALGPDLNQCCGGAVSVLFEPFIKKSKCLALFGAGHVGREIIKILDGLPINIKWIDERENEFPEQIPDNTEKIITNLPVTILSELPENSYILIITHLHSLDYELLEDALTIDKFNYMGLIGSKTKKAKFIKRLKDAKISEDKIKKITCPIGIDTIKGKHPKEIAIAVAAQLLENGIAE